MNIVLNEVEHAKKLYNSSDVGKRPAATLYLIGRYLRQKKGLKPRELYKALNDFMVSNYRDYNPDIWESTIERIVKTAKKYPLREIEYIGITRSELDEIQCIPDSKLRRLSFVMLCYAKYYNTISPQNNNWMNVSISDLFSSARVSVRYRDDRFKMLFQLRQLKTSDGNPLFSVSKKNTNTNMRLHYVDMAGDPVLKISDFRELGYEYLNFCDPGAFTRCERCGILIRRNQRRPKYCRECAKYINREKTKERMKQLRLG